MNYFTIDELTASATARKKGIKNIPNEEERLNLIALVAAVLKNNLVELAALHDEPS